jgi:pyruvate dehydrogenase E2 component (dihydrolipoamide acetyltransferase)
VETRDPTKLEQANSRRVAESKATVPHIYLEAELDLERVHGLLDEADGTTLGDVVVRAAAIALREYPRLNGAYRDGRFEIYSRVNVGITVATDAGAVVATLVDADAKSLAEVAQESRRLEAAGREGALTAPQLAGGTFTVTDLSAFAVTFEPVVHGGQAAALAVGGVRDSAIVRDGNVVAGRVAVVSLACDGRIVDPSEAARFLTRLRSLVEAGDV